MTRSDEVWKSTTLAAHYLDGVRGAVPLAAEQIDVMLRLIRAAVPAPARILDLGCGDGILGRAALAAFPAAQGVFFDFSTAMIAAAEAKAGPQAARSTFISGDYAAPDWLALVAPYAPFDAIVSGFSIHHQPDARKRTLYAELYGLLTPGGLFLNLEHVASATRWIEQRFEDHFIDSLYVYHQHNGGQNTRQQVADEYYYRPDKAANLLAPVEAQCAWLREIGFQHVDCFLKIFELALFGGIKP